MTVPARLYPLRSHPVQHRLRTDPQRFKVVPAGRRSGKTELAKRRLVVAALAALTVWPDPRFFAAAPTRDQAKAIYWADLKAMVPPEMLMMGHRGISESNLQLTLQNGAELFVVGMDKPQRIEGRPWDGGVLDEFANMKPGTWGENVRPALSDRKGWCWLIGVPEGRNHYYDLNQYALSGVDPDWASYTWPSSDILDPEEVAAAQRQLDELVFLQEYRGSFINFTGRAYYPYTAATHNAKLRHLYDDRAPLAFCFDFNVEPGVAVVLQELTLPGQYERGAGGAALLDRPITGTAIIGQVHIPRNSNTPAVCRKLIADWGDHKGQVRCYGDATGGAGGSAKVQGSDWDLIYAALRAHFKERLVMRVPMANPPERSRINALNSRLRSTDGIQRMAVDPAAAPKVVEDLEGTRLLEGGSGELDKKIDPRLTHLTDALGYYVHREFPVVRRTLEAKEIRF